MHQKYKSQIHVGEKIYSFVFKNELFQKFDLVKMNKIRMHI